MKLKKHISETITVNVKKAVMEAEPYASENLYKYYIENTAGVFWLELDKITLSYGRFTKELCEKKNESIEVQACKTISHETVHRVILEQTNWKACVAFDNIAKALEPYGVW